MSEKEKIPYNLTYMCHLKQNKTETHSERRVATRREEDFGGGVMGEGGELYGDRR